MLTCNLQFWRLEASPALHEGVVPVVKLECGIFLKEFPCLKSLAFESTFHPLERFCCKGFTQGCPCALFSTLLTVPVTHLRMPETGQQHFKRKPWKTSVECLLGECWAHTSHLQEMSWQIWGAPWKQGADRTAFRGTIWVKQEAMQLWGSESVFYILSSLAPGMGVVSSLKIPRQLYFERNWT